MLKNFMHFHIYIICISEEWMCYILDLAISKWKTMRTPFTPRRFPSMVYSDYYDRLYYYGGQNEQQQFDRVVEKYSFDVGEIIGWQEVNQPPEAIEVTSAVSEGHFIYLYGIWKYNGAGDETKLLSMDIRTEEWTYHDTAVNGMHSI